MPHFCFLKKMITDKKKKDILYCYKLREKLSKCLKENEGNVLYCNDLKIEYEYCLSYIGKQFIKS